jgi:phosphoribosylformylglycinamidine (FGAM) synthase PurS component
MRTEVLVKLAACDPWSFTVLDTLRRKFGIAAIREVERLKSWKLDFRTESEEEALGLTWKILEETALLANPNRDIWVVRGGGRLEVPEGFLRAPQAGGSMFAVRVTDREDIPGRSMEAILRRRLGLAELAGVGFSLVWMLGFAPSEHDLMETVEEIAVARSWRKGLLANPHSQEAAVLWAEQFLNGGVGL